MANANLSAMSKITKGAGAHSLSAYHRGPGLSIIMNVLFDMRTRMN